MFFSILGVIAIINICKFIQKIPLISYIGRYSIVTFAVHQPIAIKLHDPFLRIFNNIYVAEISLFILCIIYSLILTKLFIKYFPKLTAQEDLILYKKKYNDILIKNI